MPLVSIVVPCYNEQDTIRLLLDALYAQTFTRENLEIIIADGNSSDGTRPKIAQFQMEYPDLRVCVVENPQRNIPAGLNQALRAAQGEIIIRLDAHSMPRPDYVERCVLGLEQGLGDNVGGVWEIRPGGSGWVARAIAAAAAHPLGVGDAYYRFTARAQPVDTVPFGAFRASLIEQIGLFDETLLTNEDYEFNTRVRQAGGKIWLDPAIRSTYFARATLPSLARQYWRYGFWKARMLCRYPHTIRLRQALPPLFLVSVLLLGLAGIWLPVARWLAAGEVLLYALALIMVGAQVAYKRKDFSLFWGVPLAIATMHVSWGAAFLWSLLFPG
jgi:glycosyltransferase involved in cell wall biosynthesis